ncbi:MAG TPA: Xaa-Pro aminopeptidase [Thermoanaerobaculia bacterium]|nr:Xaa-Pro aminopeptidase [Thermoanaerobaculia bacterium]
MRRLLFVTFLLLVTLPGFAFERQANADYRARREHLASQLGNGVLVLFANTESEGQNATNGFRQDEDFYYLTGWREPGAALLIAPKPYAEVLFLPAHNASQERWTGPKLGADSSDAQQVTGFTRVDVLDHLRDELVRILPSPQATVITDISEQGSTPSTTPIAWLRRANAFPNYTSFKDATPLVAALRLTKDAGEVALIRKATDATVEAHKAAMRAARPGLSENELAAVMRYEFERRGCEAPAYSPIVGSGFNSTVLHYAENSGTMRDGDLVVLDVAGEYSGYASDVTRTLPVNGRFTARQREIYEVVLGAQRAAVDAFRAGASAIGRTAPNSLYKVAYDYINTHGKDAHGQPLGQYFIHGLSHYVGLEVHDAGDTAAPLAPGAVFTIEPGIYIPEERLGVRIEDLYMVGADGKLVELSAGLPKTAEEVERAMK